MGRNRIGHNLDTLIVAESFYGTIHLRVIFVIPRVVKKFMTISINDFNCSIIILPWNYVKVKKMKRETYIFLPLFFFSNGKLYIYLIITSEKLLDQSVAGYQQSHTETLSTGWPAPETLTDPLHLPNRVATWSSAAACAGKMEIFLTC